MTSKAKQMRRETAALIEAYVEEGHRTHTYIHSTAEWSRKDYRQSKFITFKHLTFSLIDPGMNILEVTHSVS